MELNIILARFTVVVNTRKDERTGEKMKGIDTTKADGETCKSASNWEGQTVFKDAVLGYISMPKAMVSELVDHPIFQRLHDIAQTGMETLYPGATHNRFCHSIGVYHLGKLAFQCFQQNIKTQHGDDIYYRVAAGTEACERVWNRWRFLFECACLLHDCGHSPLSHSLEFLYDSIEVKREDGTWENRGSDRILLDDFADSSGFQNGFYKDKDKGQKAGNAYGGQHERMSAHLIADKRGYRENMERLIKNQMLHFDSSSEGIAAVNAYDNDQFQSDLEFIARAIIGYPYSEEAVFYGEEAAAPAEQKIIYQLRNCIVKLLNGIIDVDNIDYSVRDATASGYKSAQVDYERLLKAETIALAYNHEDEGLTLDGERFDYSVRLRRFLSAEVTDGEDPLHITISGSATLLVEQKTDGSGEKQSKLEITGDIIEDDERGGDKSDVRVIHIQNGSNTRIKLSRGRLEIKPRSTDEENGTQLYIRSDCLRGIIYGTIFTGSRHSTGTDEKDAALRERVCEGELRIYPAYHKSALSVIQGALDATNFESRWIYSHHVTTYNNNFLSVFLLEKYADYLFKKEFDSLFEQLDWFLWTYKSSLGGRGNFNADELNGRLENAKKQLTEIKRNISELSDVYLPDALPAFKADGQPEIFRTLLDVLYLLYRKMPVSEGVSDLQERFCQAVRKIISTVNELPLSNVQGAAPSDLEKQIFRQSENLLKSYDGYKMGMATMSAILGMPEPKRINGRIFYRTSDADLRSAYHDLMQNASEEERARHRDLFAGIKQYESRQYLTPMWKSHAEFHFYTQGWKRGWFYSSKKKSQTGKSDETPSLIETFFSEGTTPYDPKVSDYHRSLYIYFSDDAVKPYEQELKDFWTAVKETFPLDVLVYVPQKIRHKKLAGDETYVVWKNRVVTMKDIGLQIKQDDGESYFYLYYRLNPTCKEGLNIYAFMDFMRDQLEKKASRRDNVPAGIESGHKGKQSVEAE